MTHIDGAALSGCCAPWRIFYYLFINHLKHFGIILLLASSIIFIFDAIELVRIGLNTLDHLKIAQMALLRNYNTVQRILPFIILLSTMLSYSNLNKNNELIAMRVIGLSAVQIFSPAAFIGIVLGVLHIFVFSSLNAVFLREYNALDAKLLDGRKNTAYLSKSGIWLKQESKDGQHFILNALRISQHQQQLYDVRIFALDQKWQFISQTSAKVLSKNIGCWKTDEAVQIDEQNKKIIVDEFCIPLQISFRHILDSLAAPESMSFASILNFIAVVKNIGFDVTRYQLYFGKLVLMPLMLLIMTVLAHAFIAVQQRRQKNSSSIFAPMIIGLGMHFSVDLVGATLAKGELNPILILLSLEAICLLIAIYCFLYKEHIGKFHRSRTQ